MTKRASQAGDAPTTDRTGALCLGTEVNTRGKRRRWTVEQKHQILAEGMEPGVSAAMVARKHGISRGQFYAWRQQLLLRGALRGGADTMPSLAGVNVTTTALRLEPAIPSPPASGTPATAAALVLPVQPGDRVGTMAPDGVAGRLDEDFRVEHAPTTDRKSVLNSPLAAQADCGQADRSPHPPGQDLPSGPVLNFLSSLGDPGEIPGSLVVGPARGRSRTDSSRIGRPVMDSRIDALSRVATMHRTSSPVACPCTSLTGLKPSRSI